jgi:L-arabinose isomerase
MMHAMEWLTGNSPLQAEWGQYDAAHNALFLVGHGVASPAIAGDDARVSITSAPEEWGFTGHGANLEFIMAPGPVTMGHLLNGKDGWQMIISRGESLPYPTLPCNEIHALVQIERPVKQFLVELQEYGVAHHCIVVHGDVQKEMQMLAKVWGIRSLTL